MKYLPIENITFGTKIDSEEILKRIHEIIEPKKAYRIRGFFSNKNHKPYEGSIQENSFNISRITEARNSFIPRIKGEVSEGIGLTKIQLKLSLHPVVLAFMLFWMGGVFLVLLFLLFSSVAKGTFDFSILFAMVMLAFGYSLVMIVFSRESSKTEKLLADLLDAETL